MRADGTLAVLALTVMALVGNATASLALAEDSLIVPPNAAARTAEFDRRLPGEYSGHGGVLWYGFTLEADHRFTYSWHAGCGVGTMRYSGKWRVENGRVLLRYDSVRAAQGGELPDHAEILEQGGRLRLWPKSAVWTENPAHGAAARAFQK